MSATLAPLAAIPLAVPAGVVAGRAWLREIREKHLARAVGKNIGMTVPELDALRHPWADYTHRRMTRFTMRIPAHLIGELHHPDHRAVVERKVQATVAGVMGHVAVTFDPARHRRHTAVLTLTHSPRPAPVPQTVDAAILAHSGRLVLPIGVGADGRQVGWNIRPKGAGVAHCLVYGATGAGKTEAIQTLAWGAMDRGHLVYVCDPKADDFEEWREAEVCPVATTADDIIAMVAQVRRERERRVRQYRKTRRMAMLASGQLPSIVLVVDEMQSLLSMIGWVPRRSVAAMDDLLNLAQQGRSAGIHLLVGTQWPKVDAVGGGDFRAQLEMVIALGNLKTDARNLTGITEQLTAYPPGRAMVSWLGHEVEVQVGLSDSQSRTRGAGVHRDGREALTSMDTPMDTPMDDPVDVVRFVELDPVVQARIGELRAEGRSIRQIVEVLAGEGHKVSRGAVHKYATRQEVTP